MKVFFLDLGGLYRTVVQHREEKVVDKPAVSLGSGNPRLARPIAKKRTWGSSNLMPRSHQMAF